MPNYKRANTKGGTYFFTVVTYRRQKILCNENVRDALRTGIRTVQSRNPFTIDAWVLLPDHLHCIWTLPPDDAEFGKRWAMIKRYVTSQVGCAFMRINDSLPVSNGYFSSGLECGGEIENSTIYMGK